MTSVILIEIRLSIANNLTEILLTRNNGKRNRNLYNDLMQKYKELRHLESSIESFDIVLQITVKATNNSTI